MKSILKRQSLQIENILNLKKNLNNNFVFEKKFEFNNLKVLNLSINNEEFIQKIPRKKILLNSEKYQKNDRTKEGELEISEEEVQKKIKNKKKFKKKMNSEDIIKAKSKKIRSKDDKNDEVKSNRNKKSFLSEDETSIERLNQKNSDESNLFLNVNKKEMKFFKNYILFYLKIL